MRPVTQDQRDAGRAGEAGQPAQPLRARGDVLALMLVGARHEEAVEIRSRPSIRAAARRARRRSLGSLDEFEGLEHDAASAAFREAGTVTAAGPAGNAGRWATLAAVVGPSPLQVQRRPAFAMRALRHAGNAGRHRRQAPASRWPSRMPESTSEPPGARLRAISGASRISGRARILATIRSNGRFAAKTG